MDPDDVLFPSSPTNSSPSSSDLDTESTCSFFPDRSTTLGTLMGVNFAAASEAGHVSVPSRRERNSAATAAAASKEEAERRTRVSRGRRRSWWRLCRDDMVGPTSLGDHLQFERRASGERFFADEEHVAVGGGRLFENGRVLPPMSVAAVTVAKKRRRRRREMVPVLLAGICSGGIG